MWFNVDPKLGTPIYQQIMDQIKRNLAGGLLRPGDKLPSVRELAVQLTINPNTIAKAYQELERERIIETQRGKGTFISLESKKIGLEEKEKMVSQMLERFLAEVSPLRLSKEELKTMLNGIIDNWYEGGEVNV